MGLLISGGMLIPGNIPNMRGRQPAWDLKPRMGTCRSGYRVSSHAALLRSFVLDVLKELMLSRPVQTFSSSALDEPRASQFAGLFDVRSRLAKSAVPWLTTELPRLKRNW